MTPDFYGLTSQGPGRSVNQDQFLVARLTRSARQLFTSLTHVENPVWHQESEAHLLVVADGCGAGGGRLASSLVVEVLADEIAGAARGFWGLDVEAEHELLERLEVAVRLAHERLMARKESNEWLEVAQAATTLTMAMVLGARAYVLHVGDSRAYYLHDGRLRRLTQDQTLAEALMDMGALSESQAGRAGLDRKLAQAVGGEFPAPSVGLVDLDEGDLLLLCTDGLTRHVDDDALAVVLGEHGSAQQICERLLAAALKAGGRDDITVVVGRMGPRSARPLRVPRPGAAPRG